MNDNRAPHAPLRAQQIRVSGPYLTNRRITKRIAEGFYGERARKEQAYWAERAQQLQLTQIKTKTKPCQIHKMFM